MTTAPERALERIHKLVESDFYGDDYEIKKWDITENEFFVSLVVEWGMKGDEGTLAEIYARDHAHLFIGKRGGVRYPVNKFLNGEFRHYEKRFEWVTMLQVVLDQKS